MNNLADAPTVLFSTRSHSLSATNECLSTNKVWNLASSICGRDTVGAS